MNHPNAPEEMGFRAPPHSSEAEQSLIGAVLLDNQAFDRVSWLPSNAFYEDRHRRVWEAISRQIEAGRVADIVTLGDVLGDEAQKAGGPAYWASLMQSTPSAAVAHRYAEIVRDRSLQRTLAHVATEIAGDALAPGNTSIAVLMDEAESKILQVAETAAARDDGPKEIKRVMAKVFERLDHLHCRDIQSDITGVPTGLIDLDRRTAGMQPGDLIIIAARPSMGKTALAVNITEHVALEHGLPVVFFSMEMGDTQVGNRLLSSIAKVDAHKLRIGKLSDDEWSRVTDAISRLHDAQIHIDDGGALSVLQVRARARRIRRKGKLGLVVVDYLQLMESRSRGENRATEISEITRSLKAMAKELDCPVIALSQLNRKVDERPDRRPVMSDLRESGAIEQDADVIMFIYREVVYKPDLPEEQRACAEIILGKQRNGPIGTVRALYQGRYTRFDNYADDGTTEWPGRGTRSKVGRVASFSDYKSAAAGDAAA